ncbi:chromate transporter [Chitinophaga costaii]|uniref:Chromate transporter n=1 Tax=Chitinophaga costaii TaxID=1335309 RepID=A0A1C4G597_9BACT|nr:chromate efflux transporter [Chitinophaga costaii]PUZ19699.1 hypothetical protein DCM91_20240 [Chitinophaga costaii]SCC63294.1 chromate transporter [Chitinophaga costaii]
MNKTLTLPTPATTSYGYLWRTFLRLGAVSFGGYMALVAMIQRQLVEKDKAIPAEVLAEGISIASLLPGPVAVNVVAYIGYRLRGRTGAAVAVIAVLLPAVMAMLLLSWAYFRFAFATHYDHLLRYTAGTVAGLIISTAWQFYQKDVKGSYVKLFICVAAFAALVLLKGYLVTIILLMAGGLAGGLLQLHGRKTAPAADITETNTRRFDTPTLLSILTLSAITLAYFANAARYCQQLYARIALVFSGISLSLFGGGYVMVPIMQSVLVHELHWVNDQTFLDGIAFSQLTPGPILVSSLFYGFKLAGIGGALVALVATFLPSCMLMLTVSRFYAIHQHQGVIKNILAGIKPVVTGMMLASAVKLLQVLPADPLLIGVCAITFFLALRYKISPVYLLAGALLLGIVFTVLTF